MSEPEKIEPHELAAKFSDEQMDRFIDLLLAHGEPPAPGAGAAKPETPPPPAPKSKGKSISPIRDAKGQISHYEVTKDDDKQRVSVVRDGDGKVVRYDVT